MNPSTKPKKRNAPQTRATILAAAQRAFSARSYSQVGIRDIAADADVSSPLLLRYYGSKAGLFEAALIDAVASDTVFSHGKQGFGKHLANLLVHGESDIRPPLIIALSMGDPDAQGIARQVMEKHIIKPLATWLGGPDAEVRAVEITTLAMGFVLYSQQLPLTAGKGINKKLALWFAASIQAIVDQG